MIHLRKDFFEVLEREINYAFGCELRNKKARTKVNHKGSYNEVLARWAFSEIAYKFGFTVQEIGGFLFKNHSSVTSSIRRASTLLEEGRDELKSSMLFYNTVSYLEKEITKKVSMVLTPSERELEDFKKEIASIRNSIDEVRINKHTGEATIVLNDGTSTLVDKKDKAMYLAMIFSLV